MPLSNVQHAHQLLFEYFEFSKLIEPFFAGLMRCSLKLHSFLHEFVNFVVKESNFDDLAVSGEMLGGAARTNQYVFFVETFQTSADFMGLHVMLAADFASQYLHPFAL